MHRISIAALIALAALAGPARAEFPAALSAWGGFGHGWAHRVDAETDAPFGLAGVEAAWRFAPGRALVVTYEGGGGPIMGGSKELFLTVARFDSFGHFAVTAGPELSFLSGSGVAVFCRGSAGVGHVTTEFNPGIRIYDGVLHAPERTSENGFALSGAGGFRYVFPPGPVGFLVAFHAAQTWTRHSRCGGFGVTLGLTIYPLDAPSGP